MKRVFKNSWKLGTLLCAFYLSAAVQNLAAQSNDFTIISADKDTVKLKIAAGKTLFDVKLVSGKQSFSFKTISNESGEMVMPSGSILRPVSTIFNPEYLGLNFFLFPAGATVKIFTFDAPKDFKPEKVLIVPKKGEAAIEYSANP